MGQEFSAKLKIIDGNPFVDVPALIMDDIFEKADKNTSPIPIRGAVNGKDYQQTLVRYRGHWRLYINMVMVKNSPKRIGETIELTIEFDPSDRSIEPPSALVEALEKNVEAKRVFDGLPPSRRKEIVRYIARLKTKESLERNVQRAINFLLGRGRFVGRDKP